MKNYNLNYGLEYPLKYDTTLDGKRVTHFAWQAGVGAYYAFDNYWRFGMAYRLLDAGKLATGSYAADPLDTENPPDSTMRFIASHPLFSDLLLSLTYCF